MERTGEVIAAQGEKITVAFCRPADCEKCGVCQGGRAQTQLTLKGKAQVGDRVVVDMPTGNVLKATALAYVVPLVGLIGGMLIGYVLSPSPDSVNLSALIGGGAGLGLALLVIRLADKKIRLNRAWHPQLLRVIHAKQEELKNE